MSLSGTIIIVLTIMLVVALYFVFRFGLIILRIEDAVEESLDVLDERYRSISQILEIPLFYDSPQIRQVVDDIKASRESILNVARSFASIDETAVDEAPEDNS